MSSFIITDEVAGSLFALQMARQLLMVQVSLFTYLALLALL